MAPANDGFRNPTDSSITMIDALRTPANAAAFRLELRGVSKHYPGVVANDQVDLQVAAGEIHAVLGENGAGKSTLMKIIYGVTRPSAGEIRWEGQAVRIDSPAAARALGIGMVFQHFSLFETLTVVENVALAMPREVNLRQLEQRIEAVSQRYGLPVDPRRHVHALSVGERQRVEIIRCLLLEPRLLIMDEPTSVLTPQAVRTLFQTLRQLSAEGCAILYISHKLDEIQALCHTATVLRGGKVTGHCQPAQESPQSMARMMIGKDLPASEPRQAASPGEVRLRLAGLSHAASDPFGSDLRDLHLDVHAGEIVGIAGVSGNGQQELLTVLSGEEPIAEKYPVQICGVEAGRLAPGERRRLGLCFVPEDRLGRGAVPSLSLADNALLTAAHTCGLVSRGWLRTGRARAFAEACIARFDVRCSGADAPAKSLSGGNLQKFIVGRELSQAPRLLICAQPTWGVDVGAAAFIRRQLVSMRDSGCAILVFSEELDELFEISDRIAVMAQGRLSPVLAVADTSVETVGVWMSGMWPTAPATEPFTVPASA